MEQLKKPLGKQAAVFVLILLLAGIGALYYVFFLQPLLGSISSIDNQILTEQDSLEVLRLRATKCLQMKDELQTAQDNERPVVEYNNQKALMTALEPVLAPMLGYELSWEGAPSEDATLYRRELYLTFRCSGYAQARQMVAGLHGLPFRCQVSALTSAAGAEQGDRGDGNILTDEIGGSVVITFFEAL